MFQVYQYLDKEVKKEYEKKKRFQGNGGGSHWSLSTQKKLLKKEYK